MKTSSGALTTEIKIKKAKKLLILTFATLVAEIVALFLVPAPWSILTFAIGSLFLCVIFILFCLIIRNFIAKILLILLVFMILISTISDFELFFHAFGGHDQIAGISSYFPVANILPYIRTSLVLVIGILIIKELYKK